jgi:hypothetical protein
MSILNEISRFVKPQNLMAMILIFIVVAFLNVAALYASSEHSGYRAGNDPQTMKRESGPVSYLVALDASLLYGDSRMIDWERVQWPA